MNNVDHYISVKHPARNRVCSLPTYMLYKFETIDAVNNILNEYGWELQSHMSNDDRVNWPIVIKDTNQEVGRCIFSWYRMPSGRYESTTYLS